jgi:hypothetical protein
MKWARDTYNVRMVQTLQYLHLAPHASLVSLHLLLRDNLECNLFGDAIPIWRLSARPSWKKRSVLAWTGSQMYR